MKQKNDNSLKNSSLRNRRYYSSDKITIYIKIKSTINHYIKYKVY